MSAHRDMDRQIDEFGELVDQMLRQSTNTEINDMPRFMGGLARALKSRRELMGHTLTHTMLLRHPAWHELRDLLVRALAPYPDAMRAVEDAVIEYGDKE